MLFVTCASHARVSQGQAAVVAVIKQLDLPGCEIVKILWRHTSHQLPNAGEGSFGWVPENKQQLGARGQEIAPPQNCSHHIRRSALHHV